MISSLENKTQKLTDNNFKDRRRTSYQNNKGGQKNDNKKEQEIKIINSEANITTNLTQYKIYSPVKAYNGKEAEFFWCTSPREGSYFWIEPI